MNGVLYPIVQTMPCSISIFPWPLKCHDLKHPRSRARRIPDLATPDLYSAPLPGVPSPSTHDRLSCSIRQRPSHGAIQSFILLDDSLQLEVCPIHPLRQQSTRNPNPLSPPPLFHSRRTACLALVKGRRRFEANTVPVSDPSPLQIPAAITLSNDLKYFL